MRSRSVLINSRDVAAPQRHVEIGVLAAEELDDAQAGDGAAAQRPDKERRSFAVEADDKAGRHAGRFAEMTVPEPQEIIGLIRRGQRAGLLERAPIRLGVGEVVKDFDADGAAIDLRRGIALGFGQVRVSWLSVRNATTFMSDFASFRVPLRFKRAGSQVRREISIKGWNIALGSLNRPPSGRKVKICRKLG